YIAHSVSSLERYHATVIVPEELPNGWIVDGVSYACQRLSGDLGAAAISQLRDHASELLASGRRWLDSLSGEALAEARSIDPKELIRRGLLAIEPGRLNEKRSVPRVQRATAPKKTPPS